MKASAKASSALEVVNAVRLPAFTNQKVWSFAWHRKHLTYYRILQHQGWKV